MSEPSEGIFATCFSRSINEEHLIMLTRGGGDGDVCGGVLLVEGVQIEARA